MSSKAFRSWSARPWWNARKKRKKTKNLMTDAELLRYSRHILLNEIGIEGQERILGSNALVVGAGGLGSPVALYLGSAGVGHITIVDHDTVNMTNLQRQIAHTLARVDQPKVLSIEAAIAAINPDVQVTPLM